MMMRKLLTNYVAVAIVMIFHQRWGENAYINDPSANQPMTRSMLREASAR